MGARLSSNGGGVSRWETGADARNKSGDDCGRMGEREGAGANSGGNGGGAGAGNEPGNGCEQVGKGKDEYDERGNGSEWVGRGGGDATCVLGVLHISAPCCVVIR